jgi:hypothetical protein
MSKGVYNSQGRRGGGYKKTTITVRKNDMKPTSLPCDESRHNDCDGYLTFFPHLKGYKCLCDCHKKKL